jgi:large subunit ribosomal protein L19
MQSPLVESIKFVRSGKVRRAKLYYMRDRIGKAARVQEKVMTKEQKEQNTANRAA